MEKKDARELLNVFIETHAQTDYLLTYPDENTFTAAQEEEFLEKAEESGNEIEIVAIVDGKIIGSAGIESFGNKYKIRHRAEFGISILKDYWRLGIGSALTDRFILTNSNIYSKRYKRDGDWLLDWSTFLGRMRSSGPQFCADRSGSGDNGYIPEAVRAMQKRAFEDLECIGMWCGYYDGNEKSKRCQEKCGFQYHHSEEGKSCELMGDIRTEHFTYISKEEWIRNDNR